MAKSAGLPLIDASPEIASLFYGVLGLLLGALIALGAAIIFATLLLNQHRRHLG